MRKNILSVFLYLILCITPSLGAPKNTLYYEKDYQNAWCNLYCGRQEVILSDKARIDCLTMTHAIEFDFAKKWAESIGQALYYAQATGKRAGIVLIMENHERDKKYLDRVKSVAATHNITVWTISPEDMQHMQKIANVKNKKKV